VHSVPPAVRLSIKNAGLTTCCSYEEHSIEQGKRQGYEQKNLANMGPEMIKKPPFPKMEKSGFYQKSSYK
jgi:hypothetical protein